MTMDVKHLNLNFKSIYLRGERERETERAGEGASERKNKK